MSFSLFTMYDIKPIDEVIAGCFSDNNGFNVVLFVIAFWYTVDTSIKLYNEECILNAFDYVNFAIENGIHDILLNYNLSYVQAYLLLIEYEYTLP
jgi:hypothetical protein